MNSYDVLKFKIYPWWKTKGKRADDYFLVCYTKNRVDMYHYARSLKKDGVHASFHGKWHAQVVATDNMKDKHCKGFVFFDSKSIKDPAEVAHELIHVCQFYFSRWVFPLCMTTMSPYHETFTHSHTFMMKRILEEAKKL